MADWRTGLRRGAWRSIPFLCRDTSNDAGQRLAVFEMPDSDSVVVQPLGRGVKEYRLEIYVAGDDYMAQRDRLEAALDAPGVGTLVHPYKGEIQVFAKHPECRLKELSTQGRAAFFEAVFVEEGGPQAPTQAADTAGIVQSAVAQIEGLIASAYEALASFDGQIATVQSAFTGALAAAQTAIGGALGLAAAATAGLSQDLAVLALLAPDNTAGYASSLLGLFSDYVSSIVDAFTPAEDATLAPGFQGSSRLPPLAGDPSYGLASLGAISATLVPPYVTGQILVNWTALADLVEGGAVAALASLYAQTSFDSAADADTARSQMQALIVAQIEASAGNDTLVQAWRGLLTDIVTDLTARAAAAPQIATLVTPSPMPALVLAQQIYQDGTQAAVLVQRNAPPHPLFMPMTVEYLQA